MNTDCVSCVFAEWEGDRQVQCEFDRLEKFTENGTEIVELTNQNGKNYFRIMGRVCNTCRDPSALKGTPARQWRARVRQEIIPRITMGVYVDGDDFSGATTTIQSILGQTVGANDLLIIYNRGGEDAPPDYSILLTTFARIPWRIESIKGVLGADGGFRDAEYGDAIDLAVRSKNMKSTYFVVAKAGYEYPRDYVETIDKAINDDLRRFVALAPDHDGNGLFVQTGIHNLLQGNKEMCGCTNIIEKLRQIASEENTHHMIQRFEDLS